MNSEQLKEQKSQRKTNVEQKMNKRQITVKQQQYKSNNNDKIIHGITGT